MKGVRYVICGAVLAAAFVLAPAVQALTVSPPLYNYELSPGDTVKDVIKVYNELPETIMIYPSLLNFTASQEENGSPQFYEADQDPYGTALALWITFASSEPMTIAPGGRANVEFTVTVPADAAPGGHYGAIMLGTAPPVPSAPQVGVGSQTGVLALVNVRGEVRETGGVAEYGLARPKTSYDSLPVEFFFRFENNGTTHLRPTGRIVVTDLFGRESATLEVNSDLRSVLPNSIRRFAYAWQKAEPVPGESGLQREWRNFAVGPHKATLTLKYGTQDQLVTQEIGFSVWPWRVLGLGAAALLLIILCFTLCIRSYNRMIITKYQKKMAASPAAKPETKESELTKK